MITSTELTWMRAAQEDAMPDTATITRRTHTSDGAGGSTSTPSTSSAACRLMPAGTGTEELVAQGIEVKNGRIIAWPHGTDIRAADRVTIGGREFEIKAILRAGAWATAIRTAAVEIG